MEIKTLKLKDLKPYDKNPRHNDEAVELVANSIKEFGFKVPIVIDRNNVIVCGHTRYMACKQLKIKEVPCVVADDLTDNQIKAFRLADNKVAEKAEWDNDLLNAELDDIVNIDMEDFGFEFKFDDDETGTDSNGFIADQNENVRSVYMYNLDFYDESRTTGKYFMPIVKATDYIPNDLIGFNYALSSNEFDKGIHFYIDDYQFERIWNNPTKYIEILSRYACVLMPDFSMEMGMPYSLKMWNCFRAKLISQWWQDNGLTVIPTIRFSSEETWEWCYDGIPENSVVCLSVQSVSREKEAYGWWKQAVQLFIDTKKPKMILLYGNDIDFDFGDIPIKYYRNKITDKWKE